MRIRSIEVGDAQAYIELNHQLTAETDFLLFEPGERNISVEDQEQRIRRINEDDRSIIFVAEEGERLVGHVAVFGNSNKRNKHSAYLVIGILQQFAGQGLGTKLLQEVDRWANEKNFRRIELTVMSKNLQAIGLYKKMGFKIEGTRKKSMFVNGQFIDEYYMGKIYSN